MEHTSELTAIAPDPQPVSFDAVEIAGLVIPLLFAILTIVLVAMNPDPSGSANDAKESKASEQRLEQIHRR